MEKERGRERTQGTENNLNTEREQATVLGRSALGSRLVLVLAACALGIVLMGVWLTGYGLLCRTIGRFFRVSAFINVERRPSSFYVQGRCGGLIMLPLGARVPRCTAPVAQERYSGKADSLPVCCERGRCSAHAPC